MSPTRVCAHLWVYSSIRSDAAQVSAALQTVADLNTDFQLDSIDY